MLYAQDGNVVLRKEVDSLDGNNAVFKLTQEETLKFSHTAQVSIQLRVLTKNMDALTSNVTIVNPYVCLEDEVFT